MYLAKQYKKGQTHYTIRESRPQGGHYLPRDLFDLGTDPTLFIHYPGGRGYYYATEIEEALLRKGVTYHPDDLDGIFFEFLNPAIQRVITGFDRSYRRGAHQPATGALAPPPPVHLFDKRRYHYLRFGQSTQRHIHRVPDKIFRPLTHKSRDELEHYFEEEEHKLSPHEKSIYVATIFQLAAFTPDLRHPDAMKIDTYFIDQLCGLNENALFLAGEPEPEGLHKHLIKYAIIYFDTPPVQPNFSRQYVRDFINRHRIHRPPEKTRIEMNEAERMFGCSWRDLKRMGRSELTRAYRQLALKHHPDQGGDAETFQRLSKYYAALLERKPKR